jgi:hypothetical protein
MSVLSPFNIDQLVGVELTLPSAGLAREQIGQSRFGAPDQIVIGVNTTHSQ